MPNLRLKLLIKFYRFGMMFEHPRFLIPINSVIMVMSRALIISLLLRSGDVEVNPGPMTEEGKFSFNHISSINRYLCRHIDHLPGEHTLDLINGGIGK